MAPFIKDSSLCKSVSKTCISNEALKIRSLKLVTLHITSVNNANHSAWQQGKGEFNSLSNPLTMPRDSGIVSTVHAQ